MKEAKMKGLLGAPKKGRYSYFVSNVVGSELVYSLEHDSSLATMTSETGIPIVCFWPEKEFAEFCKKGMWIDANVVEMALSDFYLKILADLKQKKCLVGIFYNGIDMATVSANLLKRDMKEVIDNVGSDWIENDIEYKDF